ncbi:high-potential iron-sulfur protein [Allopusillimonas ginsengisoli]|uniref:high-potential iron-sulfur protein n=1 Tax=Allopusillimonas ginsengisoli TaxID=453575 RepID=UPI0010207F77|nr:high-potential iron-sulfur protein [Allopusillimonas ginsengisoli]TEA79770.1 iron oxidase [Allopusillimonas ginsengisoli]
MTNTTFSLTARRKALQKIAGLAGATAALPLLYWSASARAQANDAAGKASKSAVQYQDHPKGKSDCANCANFIPGKSADAAGGCTVVAGDISPKGWCLAYAGNG